MASIFTSSLYNSVKLMNQQASWNTLKSQKNFFEKTNLIPRKGSPISLNENLSLSNIDINREKVKMRLSSIDAKLKGGGKITTNELNFLKKHSPPLYRNALEVIHERRAYKDALHRCNTKEDVERLHRSKLQGFLSRMDSIQKSNLSKEKRKESLDNVLKILMGCQSEHMEFTNSHTYKNLPRTKNFKLPTTSPTQKQHENTISLDIFQKRHQNRNFLSVTYKREISKNRKNRSFSRQV